MSGVLKKKILWDGIITRTPIRPPTCYLPAMWEVILNRDIGELAKNVVATVPDTAPAVIEKHLNERIRIVEKLKANKKLDGKIADMAISHFKAHLEELETLRM